MKHAKLWKRILNEGINGFGLLSDIPKTVKLIISSPIIVDSRTGQGEPLQYSDIRNPSVPFPQFFIEGSDEDETDPITAHARWGALVSSGIRDKDGNFRMDILCIAGISRACPAILGNIQFTLGPSSPQICDTGNEAVVLSPIVAYSPEIGSGADEAIQACAQNVFDCLRLLSCKNVSLSPRENDPKQVSRAVKRHGGTPDSYRYHVLVVRPPGAKSGDKSKEQEIGIMPRHVCRGHFAEYGPDFGKGLLFGKYAGRFFVPPCFKGKKENGVVEKDYEIPVRA